MKKKTLYKWMGTIVVLTAALFAGIYYFHLQDNAIKVAAPLKGSGSTPTLSYFIQGDMSSPLDKPMDVAKIGQFLYVTDTNHKQVQVFDSTGTPLFKFGKQGTGQGEFQFPYGIDGDKDGNVYVADLYNNRISIFTPKGQFIRYFTDASKKANFLKTPAGLRIFNNNLFVTDIQLGKVIKYDLNGNKLLELSAASSKDDTLNAPNAVAVDSGQNIYVSDTGNQRIVTYDKKGKFVRIINGSINGTGASKFVNPRGIGIKSDGTLLMVDNMTHYVYGFDKTGKQVLQFGGLGSDKDQFYLPNVLYVDDKGEVFITDTVNQRVALYY
ncbi:MAG: 6-bladed beta-propeller [Bacillota bacterium]|nr:6-bladed beta-propeller [Bacillota bacterium]